MINPVDYTKLNNELRREIDRAKERYINEKCYELMKLQQTSWCIWRWKTWHGKRIKMRTFGAEDYQGKFATNKLQSLKVCEDYIRKFYDRTTQPQGIEMETEEIIDEDWKGCSIPRSEVERVVKDMKKMSATVENDIPVGSKRNWNKEADLTFQQDLRNWRVAKEFPRADYDHTERSRKPRDVAITGPLAWFFIQESTRTKHGIGTKDRRRNWRIGEYQFGDFRKGGVTIDVIWTVSENLLWSVCFPGEIEKSLQKYCK